MIEGTQKHAPTISPKLFQIPFRSSVGSVGDHQVLVSGRCIFFEAHSQTAGNPSWLNRVSISSVGSVGSSCGYKCGESGKVRHKAPSASPQDFALSRKSFQRISPTLQS